MYTLDLISSLVIHRSRLFWSKEICISSHLFWYTDFVSFDQKSLHLFSSLLMHKGHFLSLWHTSLVSFDQKSFESLLIAFSRSLLVSFGHSRRRSDFKYLHLQTWTVFPSTLFSYRDSIYARQNLVKILRSPLIYTGLLWCIQVSFSNAYRSLSIYRFLLFLSKESTSLLLSFGGLLWCTQVSFSQVYRSLLIYHRSLLIYHVKFSACDLLHMYTSLFFTCVKQVSIDIPHKI